MTNKRTTTFMAETVAVFLLFVSSGEADLSGFVVSDFSVFDPLPEINYLQDPTSPELKKKIVSALKTLSVEGKQSCLVQYWAATTAGNTHLLTTKDQPFGTFGNYEGLELYRKACLHHKLYVHRQGKTSFGLPGHAFEDRTPHQTQNMHHYPEDQRPPCEDKAIFSNKWGSFAVPVILATDECIGVLEFVDTEPTHTYDDDISEVSKALKFAGFESSNTLDTRKERHITHKRKRETKSSKYGRYDILVACFGFSKGKAMEFVENKFFPKKQEDAARETLHGPESSTKKAKKEYKVIESTFTNVLRNIGITEWPFIRKTTDKASCAPRMGIDPTVSGASSLGSLKADDLTSCLVKVEAFEGSLEQISTINTSGLDVEINQTASYETNITEPFFESACARAHVMPEGDKLECLGNETAIIQDLSADRLMFSNECLFGNEGSYELLGTRFNPNECLCGDEGSYELPGTRFNPNETSSSGILADACDHNSVWPSELITTSNTSFSEIHPSSLPILNDVGDFNSSGDEGFFERLFEQTMTTNTSEINQSPVTGIEQESCEMGEEFFSVDTFEDLMC